MKRAIGLVIVSILLAACAGAASSAESAKSQDGFDWCGPYKSRIERAVTLEAAMAAFKEAAPYECGFAEPDPAFYEAKRQKNESERRESAAEAKRCGKWQKRITNAKTYMLASDIWVEALDDDCDLPIPAVKSYKEVGTSSSLPTMNGIAYKWADNPNCDYFACFGMTVRADEQSCPNTLYVEINLLDAKGNVVGYSNDTVGSLSIGQKAKLTFDFTESGVKTAQLSEISCY